MLSAQHKKIKISTLLEAGLTLSAFVYFTMMNFFYFALVSWVVSALIIKPSQSLGTDTPNPSQRRSPLAPIVVSTSFAVLFLLALNFIVDHSGSDNSHLSGAWVVIVVGCLYLTRFLLSQWQKLRSARFDISKK